MGIWICVFVPTSTRGTSSGLLSFVRTNPFLVAYSLPLVPSSVSLVFVSARTPAAHRRPRRDSRPHPAGRQGAPHLLGLGACAGLLRSVGRPSDIASFSGSVQSSRVPGVVRGVRTSPPRPRAPAPAPPRPSPPETVRRSEGFRASTRDRAGAGAGPRFPSSVSGCPPSSFPSRHGTSQALSARGARSGRWSVALFRTHAPAEGLRDLRRVGGVRAGSRWAFLLRLRRSSPPGPLRPASAPPPRPGAPTPPRPLRPAPDLPPPRPGLRFGPQRGYPPRDPGCLSGEGPVPLLERRPKDRGHHGHISRIQYVSPITDV